MLLQALNDFIDRKLQASPIKSLIVYPEGIATLLRMMAMCYEVRHAQPQGRCTMQPAFIQALLGISQLLSFISHIVTRQLLRNST